MYMSHRKKYARLRSVVSTKLANELNIMMYQCLWTKNNSCLWEWFNSKKFYVIEFYDLWELNWAQTIGECSLQKKVYWKFIDDHFVQYSKWCLCLQISPVLLISLNSYYFLFSTDVATSMRKVLYTSVKEVRSIKVLDLMFYPILFNLVQFIPFCLTYDPEEEDKKWSHKLFLNFFDSS